MGNWGSARGSAKHLQACYYFILRSKPPPSKTNQSKPAVLLAHLMDLARARLSPRLCGVNVLLLPAAAELNKSLSQMSLKRSVRSWCFGVSCCLRLGGIQWSHTHTHSACQETRCAHVCAISKYWSHAHPRWAQANKPFTVVDHGEEQPQ